MSSYINFWREFNLSFNTPDELALIEKEKNHK